MLLSIPGKVLSRIILERLETTLDKTLRDEQAGFRQDRFCTDHIATLTIIIEQSLEWQFPLYSIFVDFHAEGVCSVDREVISKLKQHYRAFPKVRTSPSSSSCMKMPPAKSYTRDRKADRPLPGTDRSTSGLHIVADNISNGGELDYAAVHSRPEDRHPVHVDIH